MIANQRITATGDQVGPPRLQLCEFTLNADEFCTLGFAVISEPVGKDQTWRIIVERSRNRLHKCFVETNG